MNTPRRGRPAKAVENRGIEYASSVTVPICMDLTSADFPQLQSQLVTSVPAAVAQGAQLAVLHRNLRPRLGGTYKKLYLVRRREPHEEIHSGQLYLIEMPTIRAFRIVYPATNHVVRLKTCGIRGTEALYELRKIASMWLVCAALDYVEPTYEPDEY